MSTTPGGSKTGNKPDSCTASTTTVETPAITLQILEDLSLDDSSSSQEGQENVEESVGRFVWPTARPLLRHLANINIHQSTVVVVELGAGCGVLGMGLAAAAKAFPKLQRVIVTDHDLDWLQRNVALNERALQQANASSVVEALRLDWKNPRDIATIQSRVEELLRPFSNLASSESVPLVTIVGSDILYNHKSHKALASTLRLLSSEQSTRIILGYPDRDDDEQSFLPFARDLFGDTFPSSKPLPIISTPSRTDKPRRKRQMDLRIIDFTVVKDQGELKSR